MKKIIMLFGIVLVALFLVGCATQKTTPAVTSTGPNAPSGAQVSVSDSTPLDSEIAGLDNETNTSSVDSELNDVNSDIDKL